MDKFWSGGSDKELFEAAGIMNGGMGEACCWELLEAVVSLVGILKGTACTLEVLLAELALLTEDEGFE